MARTTTTSITRAASVVTDSRPRGSLAHQHDRGGVLSSPRKKTEHTQRQRPRYQQLIQCIVEVDVNPGSKHPTLVPVGGA